MHSTNYRNTFILTSPDSTTSTGLVPPKAGSIAQLQFGLIHEHPYRLTSDDLLFEVHAIRNNISDEEREAARNAFFATPKACLRASPLVKQFGWGIHHDEDERIALYPVDSDDYRALGASADVKVVAGMRSKRA